MFAVDDGVVGDGRGTLDQRLDPAINGWTALGRQIPVSLVRHCASGTPRSVIRIANGTLELNISILVATSDLADS
jgi:hypothetical protein